MRQRKVKRTGPIVNNTGYRDDSPTEDNILKTGYIYQIKIGNNYYIGSTNDYNKRKQDHIYYLKNKKHVNRYVQNAYNKHKKADFSIRHKLKNIRLEELLDLEQRYINLSKYNLNIAKTASSPQTNTGYGVIVYNSKGRYLGKFETVRECCEVLSVS